MAWEQPITEFAQDVISPNSLAWTTEEHYSDTWDNRPYQEDIQYNVLAYVRDSTPKGVANYILGDANSDTALYWGINNFGSYQVNLYGVVAGEHMQIATFGNLADQHGWGLNISLALGRDTSTNTYNIITLAERLGSTVYTSYYSQPNGQQGYIRDIVNYAFSVQPISYNWQSVPSISGKNGILQSLVQIKEEALNDGEPVSQATVLSFDSLGNINIPSVIDEQMPVDPSDVTSVTATYLIPALEDGTYGGIKLLVKKGSIPTSEEDADKVVNLDEPTSILRIDSKSVGNLDEDSHYYFVVKLVDEIGTEATSDPKDIWTSHSEGWTFDYTGEIQTFTAPKTGIYQLETWGAQGGDASDGTNTARGGYGAYAVGEVFLTQGDTLYINVGGQNGYGGGGKVLHPLEVIPGNYFGRDGYVADLDWVPTKTVTLSSDHIGYNVYLFIVHREALTLPSGWTLVDTRHDKANSQYISVYKKVHTGAETVNIDIQYGGNTGGAAVVDVYLHPDYKVEGEYAYLSKYLTSYDFTTERKDYPKIYVFSGAYVNNQSTMTISPSPNGWIRPNTDGSTVSRYRCMFFYTTGEEHSQIDFKINMAAFSETQHTELLMLYKIVEA